MWCYGLVCHYQNIFPSRLWPTWRATWNAPYVGTTTQITFSIAGAMWFGVRAWHDFPAAVMVVHIRNFMDTWHLLVSLLCARFGGGDFVLLVRWLSVAFVLCLVHLTRVQAYKYDPTFIFAYKGRSYSHMLVGVLRNLIRSHIHFCNFSYHKYMNCI